MTSKSRKYKNELGVWQRRFWEHAINSDEEFEKYVDYIHYNPVKHGYIESPVLWKESSIHYYIKTGKYSSD